jgi:hypothetical protein
VGAVVTRKLTGRIRYRSQRRPFSRREEIVLQVEESGSEMMLLGGWPQREQFIRWRDAGTTDLISIYVEISEIDPIS